MIGNPYTQDEVAIRVDKFWSFESGFPQPKTELPCPVCRSSQGIIKDFRFFKRGGPTPNKFRCDVVFKCTECSMQWAHGVPISEELFKLRVVRGKHKTRQSYSWREAQCLLEKQEV